MLEVVLLLTFSVETHLIFFVTIMGCGHSGTQNKKKSCEFSAPLGINIGAFLPSAANFILFTTNPAMCSGWAAIWVI